MHPRPRSLDVTGLDAVQCSGLLKVSNVGQGAARMPDDESQAPDNQVRFRADPEMVAWIRERMSPRANGLGGVAKRDLERYYSALQEALPIFADDEAVFILDALSRERLDQQYGRLSHRQAHLIWAVVSEASRKHDLAKRWRIDEAAVINKLRDLTHFQRLAVMDANERAYCKYWASLSVGSRDDAIDRAVLLRAALDVGLAEGF